MSEKSLRRLLVSSLRVVVLDEVEEVVDGKAESKLGSKLVLFELLLEE